MEDKEILRCVARTSLRTKLYEDLADQLTDIVVDAVLTIRKPDEPIDLFMVILTACTTAHHTCLWSSQHPSGVGPLKSDPSGVLYMAMHSPPSNPKGDVLIKCYEWEQSRTAVSVRPVKMLRATGA